MRNYVIINGVNSLTIKGLAINELPPIVKAPMRVLQEEIDGRDGDIITDLGYGAYDKIMTIGLYDGYDINEIIAFFNEEGTIVFSDEADKYYNFKIIEQIDYERLIKFRTASITFHCQPFKYPLTETPVEITNEYVEAEGTNLTLTPTSLAPISIDLKGNTYQYSTTGKNKLYFNEATSTNGVTFTPLSNGKLKINGKSTDVIYLNIGKVYLEANTDYTFSISYGESGFGPYLNASVSSGSNWVNLTTRQTTFQVASANTYNVAYYIANDKNVNQEIELQIEKGSSVSSWEKYTGGSPAPSPLYPFDIHNVSGDNTIEICGKNLFNVTDFEAQFVNNKILNDNGVEISDSQSKYSKYMIFLKENTTYHIKGWWQRVYYFDENKVFKSRTSATDTKDYNYTPTENEYIEFQIRNEFWSANKGQEQVEIGNTASTYTPYVSQTQLISLGDIELCKIGNYQDYIYKTDKWYLHKEIGKLTLKGTEDYTIFSSTSTRVAIGTDTISNLETYSLNTDLPNLVCNYFSPVSQADTWLVGLISRRTQDSKIYFMTEPNTTLEQWKTWLSTHNTIVYYVLATPQEIEITDSTLLSQLEAIKNMNSYDGTTNISQENNDEPFIIKAKAMKQGSGTATITNSGNIYSKPTIDIEGTGIVDVYIGENQIFSVNVDEEVIIDSTNLEAYKPDGTLANRNVTGNIANLKLPTGNSIIKVDGDIDKATITNYTRYL